MESMREERIHKDRGSVLFPMHEKKGPFCSCHGHKHQPRNHSINLFFVFTSLVCF